MVKYIIFKFDDFSNVSKNVQKLDKYIRKENIKITWGVIGKHFEKISDKDIEWCKNALESGYYTFWNHGYTHEMNEFENIKLEEQIKRIQRTQNIVKNKLNYTMNTFGVPCNHYNKYTKEAIENVEEIEFWYYGENDYSRNNLMRTIELEVPLFHPNYKTFKFNFKNYSEDLIVLQGHPNTWKFWQFYNFKKIINFLKKENCIFIFPNEIKECR